MSPSVGVGKLLPQRARQQTLRATATHPCHCHVRTAKVTTGVTGFQLSFIYKKSACWIWPMGSIWLTPALADLNLTLNFLTCRSQAGLNYVLFHLKPPLNIKIHTYKRKITEQDA